MGRKLLLLNITINPVGAFLTFLYFRYISPGFHGQPEMSHAQSYLIFAIGTGVVICIFYWFIRRWTDPLIRVVEGQTPMDALDSISVPRLKRRAIQFAPFIALTNFVAWIFAGFIFGFLEPVFSQVFLGAAPRNLIECLRVFFGITVIGGTIAALVIYFTAENMWRKVVARFFPEGDLSQVKEALKVSVKMRLIVVFLAISLFPLPLLGAAAYTKTQALHTADAITRTQIMSSLLLEVIFITAICVATSLLLSIFVAKSVSDPLKTIENAMKEVEEENLNVRVEIISNDEIGSVAEGFNHMVRGLEESQFMKESFGRYVTQEIRDEILAGRVSLDGEMKRATLLFSDLRSFTPLVESTHPKQVITIMNQYFSQMTEAIKDKRGLVLQYVGDEIEAVFGAPVSYDDHPERAVEAALEMRRRLILLNHSFEKQGFAPLQHGIGIHTGAVLAGNIGSKDRISYALVGDTVNLASRIEGLTKEFSTDIILSQTTHDLLTGFFHTEQLPAVKVKGRTEEILIYKLLGDA
jgi:adenylate cyclase